MNTSGLSLGVLSATTVARDFPRTPSYTPQTISPAREALRVKPSSTPLGVASGLGTSFGGLNLRTESHNSPFTLASPSFASPQRSTPSHLTANHDSVALGLSAPSTTSTTAMSTSKLRSIASTSTTKGTMASPSRTTKRTRTPAQERPTSGRDILAAAEVERAVKMFGQR